MIDQRPDINYQLNTLTRWIFHIFQAVSYITHKQKHTVHSSTYLLLVGTVYWSICWIYGRGEEKSNKDFMNESFWTFFELKTLVACSVLTFSYIVPRLPWLVDGNWVRIITILYSRMNYTDQKVSYGTEPWTMCLCTVYVENVQMREWSSRSGFTFPYIRTISRLI